MMFGGIVETIGAIIEIKEQQDCLHFTINPKEKFGDLQIGNSVSVNGVCLTVTKIQNNFFHITAVPETLRLTNLCQLKVGSLVNLERSLKVQSRIGGHYIQGHVDGVGEILDLQMDGGKALITKISLPSSLQKYVVRKSYIALDGMSITIVDTTSDWFTVTFIPHTREVTIANQYQKGTLINIEVDILGKYVEKYLEVHHAISS